MKYVRYWNFGEFFEFWIVIYNIFCNIFVDWIVLGVLVDVVEIWVEIGWEDCELVIVEFYFFWVIEVFE